MIFVDTWAWVALADSSDPYHRKAKAQHRKLTKKRHRYVTTNFVLGETISYMYDAIGAVHAQAFIDSILAAADAGTYRLVHLSPDQFRRAWTMRQKYHDKPAISFVDFTPMVVMQDLGLTDVFTCDDHFHQVNLGFQLVP
jgi:predicted nucleic acid-binding protein